MTVETNPALISDLNAAWPLDTDPRFEGAAHIREIKSILQKQFLKPDAALTGSFSTLNAIMGQFDANGVFKPTSAVDITHGATISGALQTGSQTITGASGTNRQVIYASDGKGARFATGVDGVAETGNTLGSNFYISRFDDAGNFIDNPMYINRSSGTATFSQRPFLQGPLDWNTYQAVTAKDVSLNYVSGTSAGSNVAVTNIQMVGAPNGDNPNAYLQVGTGQYAIGIPSLGNVSRQLVNYAQPKGDYATNNTLASDVSNLQNQINGKQPSGNYVGTSGNQGGTGDQKILAAYFSVVANCPWMSGYGQDGGTHQYLLAQLNDLPVDRSQKFECFTTQTFHGQRVTFPNNGFSSTPVFTVNSRQTGGRAVLCSYDNEDSKGFTIIMQREDQNGMSNVNSPLDVMVMAKGSR